VATKKFAPPHFGEFENQKQTSIVKPSLKSENRAKFPRRPAFAAKNTPRGKQSTVSDG